MVERALEVMEQLEETSMVRHLPVQIDEVKEKQEIFAEVGEKSGFTRNDSGNVGPQLSLFPEESLYLDELRKLNLNDMTPLQALNYLHELTDRLRD